MSVDGARQGGAVGIGEIQTARAGDPPLTSYGLGSCVGVAAVDPLAKVGGLAHVMLPDAAPDGKQHPKMPARYAHTAVDNLTAAIEAAGGVRRRLVFKVAGGARILSVPGFEDRFDIGRRNIQSIKQYLGAAGFKLAAEDVGGHTGRTLRFDVGTGTMRVRQIGESEEREL